jgi:hypothetical protein
MTHKFTSEMAPRCLPDVFTGGGAAIAGRSGRVSGGLILTAPPGNMNRTVTRLCQNDTRSLPAGKGGARN